MLDYHFLALINLEDQSKFTKTSFQFKSNKNVVYKLACKNCDATYVGQTSRQLKTRLVEHRNYINRNTSIKSVITDHRIRFNYDVD